MMHRTGVCALGAGAAIAAGAAHVHARPTTTKLAGPPTATALVAESAALPKPATPAFVPAKPVPLSTTETRARYAPVLHPAAALRAPSPSSPEVAPLTVETPEGTTNIVEVLGEAERDGRIWVHVRLPVLHSETAWVPRDYLGGYGFVHTRLIVDRAHLRATLLRDGHPIFSAPIGIGTAESPTPGGQFYIREELSGFGDPFYGPVAFGTSARSTALTDWPGGGFIGIHGTNEPRLIPGRISHGCIRMRNPDILRLRRLMPVGTPVTIL
jgi:lipoprotein-anchoring transpeptidase ErfK/SrfK